MTITAQQHFFWSRRLPCRHQEASRDGTAFRKY
jgi:hypothetical protein